MRNSNQNRQAANGDAATATQPQGVRGISVNRRALHWLTAIVVVMLIAIGKWISDLELTDIELVRESLWKFSLHKTLGVFALVITLVRLASMWAGNGFTHSAHSRLEVVAASVVQTYFLCALLILPLSGLVMHGFAGATAPIWIIPDNWLHASQAQPDWVSVAVSVHHLVANGLLVAIILHLGGVIKHQFVDRDQTLHRMWTGHSTELLPSPVKLEETKRSVRQGQWIGFALVGLVVATGTWMAGADRVQAKDVDLESASAASTKDTTARSEITLRSISENSVLRVYATQGKDPFEAEFARFEVVAGEDASEMPVAIDVLIDSGSFASGVSDRDQVVAGSDWMDVSVYPTANWRATTISPLDDGGFNAEGELTIRQMSAPVSIRFEYRVDAESGHRQLVGEASFDRSSVELGRGDFAAESAAGKIIRVEFDVQLKAE